VGNGEDRDLVSLDQVADREGEPGQEEPPDSCGFADSRPEGPGHRALGDRIERVAHLIDEVGSETRQLKFVPVACRVEVGRGSRVEADLHGLPTMPALCEARLDRFPVLGGDRARPNIADALLQFCDPCLGRVAVGSLIQAQEQFVSDLGPLSEGERESVGEQVGSLWRHGTSIATGGRLRRWRRAARKHAARGPAGDGGRDPLNLFAPCQAICRPEWGSSVSNCVLANPGAAAS
jgi:hypothetical protein